MVTYFIQLLSLGTIFINIATIVIIFALLFYVIKKGHISGLPKTILKFSNRLAIPISFLIALTSMSMSLFFSEIARFQPCLLCWYQRIAMYPLVFLFGVSLLKKESKHILYYAMPLVLIGGVIAGIHTFEQLSANPILPCSSIGLSESCTRFFFRTYGYITIPTMSFSAFLFIASLLLVKIKTKV